MLITLVLTATEKKDQKILLVHQINRKISTEEDFNKLIEHLKMVTTNFSVLYNKLGKIVIYNN